MLEINKCKLVPGITANWGEITGDITNQTDLVDYISTHGGGGGVAAWGSISGNISDQTDLMSMFGEYATQSFVTSALSGYATESWVLNSYTNEVVAEACGKAEGNVMEWVSSQGYLTSSALSGYATEQFVTNSLSGYATESWVSSQGYLTSVPSEYATQSWVSSQGYLTSSALSDTVQYDREIPIGDQSFDEPIDVLKRETIDWSDEIDEIELTKQLVLGYKKVNDNYNAIVINDGFDDQLKLGQQEFFVEEDLGTPFLVKGKFIPYYLESYEHRVVTDSYLDLYTDDGYGDFVRYIPVAAENPVAQEPYQKLLIGASTAKNSWNGLVITDEGEVGIQKFSIETDAQTSETRLVEGEFYEFATQDYVDSLVGTALDMTNDILDQGGESEL